MRCFVLFAIAPKVEENITLQWFLFLYCKFFYTRGNEECVVLFFSQLPNDIYKRSATLIYIIAIAPKMEENITIQWFLFICCKFF